MTGVQTCALPIFINGGFDTDASDWVIANTASIGGYSSSYGNPTGSVYLFNPVFDTFSPSASQLVSGLTPGTTYMISGDFIGGGKNIADNSFGVACDGIFLFETASPGGDGWHSFSVEYVATSTSTLLNLSSQLNGTDGHYYIDNISMLAVPEPGSLWLAGLGGVGGATVLKRFGRSRVFDSESFSK